jgi:hypothetical protein
MLAPTAWSADTLAQRIEACAQHPDDGARLKCFDEAARALRAEHATANPAGNGMPAKAMAERATASSNTAGVKRAASAEGADTASAAAPGLSRSAVPRPRDNPASGQSVTARVIAISKTPALQRRIELDNGQVWQENEHDKSLLLAAGDNVQIQAGALRSFILRVPSGGQTHVRRVR